MEIKWIDITLLKPNSYNSNRLSPEEFKGLVESIQNAGYCEQNPILARPLNGYFEIVDGEHRWRACLELKLEKIPVIVREMDDLEAHRLCVILNKDRGSPDYFKLSKLFNEDLERGMQQKDLAKHYGFAEGTISQILNIYPRLKKDIKLDMSNFSNRHLLMLARVESDFLRSELVKRAREGNWSSNKIQDKASLCNKVLSYLRAKTQDEKLINQILEELVEETFTYPESTLLNEIDLKFKEFLAQRIIQGDAFEEMAKLEPESIDLIVTDPPYNISDPSKLTKKGGEIVELDIADWDKQTEEEYEQFILKLLLAIKRLLKPSGSFYLFLDKAFSGRAWKMCKEIGLKPKNIVHWRKTNPVPQVRKNNYLSAIEHILYGVKGEKYTFNFKSDNEMHNVIELPIETGLERQSYPHETAKPLELIEHLIEVSSNPKDLVLDPFAGRGTTAIACLNKGRNWIVIEKDSRHVKTIKRWVEERAR